MEKSFGKVVFPFLVGNFLTWVWNSFFGFHFVTVYLIFYFFLNSFYLFLLLLLLLLLYLGSFGLLYQWRAFQHKTHSGKYFLWVRVQRDPLTTNGSEKYLDHVSDNINFFRPLLLYHISRLIVVWLGQHKNGPIKIPSVFSQTINTLHVTAMMSFAKHQSLTKYQYEFNYHNI